MDPQQDKPITPLHTREKSEAYPDDNTKAHDGAVHQQIDTIQGYDDNVVNENLPRQCTLKQHKRLKWFWNLLSALHECGHVCMKFPCMAEGKEGHHPGTQDGTA